MTGIHAQRRGAAQAAAHAGARSCASATLAVLLASCTGAPPPLSTAELDALELAYLDRSIVDLERIGETIGARWDLEWREATARGTPDDRVFDILAISGGGAKGAFGAGFLVGWGEVTDPAFARPQFDMVTGVSTGSLLAPMALVGDGPSYALADETYRNPAPDWIRRRSLLDILFGEESLFSDDGLLRTIESTIGSRVPVIAREGESHRLLLVGATNLNQGTCHAWNLTELAARVQAGSLTERDFCRHCLSSASIPVAFPPQLIDDNLYVDGSTTNDILIFTSLAEKGGVLDHWRRTHAGASPPKIRVWVIANTALVSAPTVIDTRDFAVAGRSLGLAVQAGLVSQLKILELQRLSLHDRFGIDMEFRYVAMPDGFQTHGAGLFNQADMVAMSDLGRTMGRDPANWMTEVPGPLDELRRRNELRKTMAEAGTQ